MNKEIFFSSLVFLLIFMMLAPTVAPQNPVSNENTNNKIPTDETKPILPVRGIVMPFNKKVEKIDGEEYTFYRPIHLWWPFSKVYTYSDNVEIGFKKGQLKPVLEKFGPIIFGQITEDPLIRDL
jgi:hypothetical protein